MSNDPASTIIRNNIQHARRRRSLVRIGSICIATVVMLIGFLML